MVHNRRATQGRPARRSLRRFIIAAMAAALAAPVFAVTPASAVILFGCTSFSGTDTMTPGLTSTLNTQDLVLTSTLSGCSNGQGGTLVLGTGSFAGAPAVPSFRTLNAPGCPLYANPAENKILWLGSAAPPSFKFDWDFGADSTGFVKLKAGPNPMLTKFEFVITAGQYAPPAGQKTKFKGSVSAAPTDSGNCTSDPFNSFSFTNSGNMFINQK